MSIFSFVVRSSTGRTQGGASTIVLQGEEFANVACRVQGDNSIVGRSVGDAPVKGTSRITIVCGGVNFRLT